MTQPLLQVGAWLNTSGEAIYGTRTWWYQTQDITMTDVRFTTSKDAFYILAIARPTGGLKLTAPVPVTQGDKIVLLGGSGVPLNWSSQNGVFTVEVSDAELNKVSLPAWAFKVVYAIS
jgi:alpha-L-fucosidase